MQTQQTTNVLNQSLKHNTIKQALKLTLLCKQQQTQSNQTSKIQTKHTTTKQHY